MTGYHIPHETAAPATYRPCPFCGSRNVDFHQDEDPTMSYGGHVECFHCGARGVPFYCDEPPTLENNKRQAMQHWNNRVRA